MEIVSVCVSWYLCALPHSSGWGVEGPSCLLLPLELSQEGSGRQKGTPVQPDPSSCPSAWWRWLTLSSRAVCRGSSMCFCDCHLPHLRHPSSHPTPVGSLRCPHGHQAPSGILPALLGDAEGCWGPPRSHVLAELQELEAEGKQHQAECEVVSPGD